MVMEASGIFPISRDDKVGKHTSPTKIPIPQEPKREIISVLGNNGMGLDIYTIKGDNQIKI